MLLDIIERVKDLLLKNGPERISRLLRSRPKKIVWATKPRQRWALAYNTKTLYRTTSDVFSSELSVYYYPIGLGEMTVPKKFIASDVFARLFYSMEWPGADLRPEKKYRSLRQPGVIEVIY